MIRRPSATTKLRWWLEDHYLIGVAAAFIVAVVMFIHPNIPDLPDIQVPQIQEMFSPPAPDYGAKPYIIDWMIGNALGQDVYHKAAVLDRDMTVYPADDATTIYPSNIMFSRELDPRSGYYAIGYEGTVQPNIWYDNSTRKFYNRFISEPTVAGKTMVYSPGQAGEQGAEVMRRYLASYFASR